MMAMTMGMMFNSMINERSLQRPFVLLLVFWRLLTLRKMAMLMMMSNMIMMLIMTMKLMMMLRTNLILLIMSPGEDKECWSQVGISVTCKKCNFVLFHFVYYWFLAARSSIASEALWFDPRHRVDGLNDNEADNVIGTLYDTFLRCWQYRELEEGLDHNHGFVFHRLVLAVRPSCRNEHNVKSYIWHTVMMIIDN